MRLFRRFWPVTMYIVGLVALMIIMTVFSGAIEDRTKLVIIHFTITLFAATAAFLLNEKLRGDVRRFLRGVAGELSPKESSALDNLPTAVAAINRWGEVVWYNRLFSENLLNGGDYNGGSITKINRSFDLDAMRKCEKFLLKWDKSWYECVSSVIDIKSTGGFLVYFNDITELKKTEERFIATRPSVMVIVFDNEDELLKARESERVRVFSEVDALINRWADQSAGICWANVRDKSLLVMEEEKAKKLIDEQFTILKQAKQISVEDGTPVTLSIGVGRAGSSIEECENWALQALDMALGRGGDQAVIRTSEGYTFVGGVSKSSERQSKVKVRMLGSELTDILKTCDNCIIMGHRFSDLDSIGASIGVYSIARALEKPAVITTSEKDTLALDLIKHYKKAGNNCFIEPFEALDRIREKTLLVIVDTHSPDFVENKALYERAENVVVIDHHRLMVDHIANARLMIHEPYASSASEIVAEIAASVCEKAIGRPESEALLAGIMLDTKNYVLRTGVRTFEASAFLKKRGADTVDVKRLFSDSMDTYTEKSKLVSEATIYKNCAIAISDKHVQNQRIICSQAADDMLTISEVNASFVMFDANGMINISARSLGRINVQLIMEQLGGGGHQTMAGAQLENTTEKDAMERLKAAIDKSVR